MCTRSQEKKQALLNIQKKKQLLSTLFKNLRVIGLSYRRGITFASKRKENDLLMVEAFNILQMQTLKTDMEFRKMLVSSSQDIDHYFYKSIAQHRMLEMCMQTPCKDLTLDIIHRIQGYSGDLSNYVLSQRQHLVKVSKDVDKIGLFLQTIAALQQNKKFPEQVLLPPDHDELLVIKKSISALQIHFMMLIRQLQEVLECAPKSSNPVSEFMKCKIDPFSKPMWFSSIRYQDERWNEIMSSLAVCKNDVEENIQEAFRDEKSSLLSTWEQHYVACDVLTVIKDEISKFQYNIRNAKFESKQWMLKGFTVVHSEMETLEKQIQSMSTNFANKLPDNSSESLSKAQIIFNLIKKLSKEVLLGYQALCTICLTSVENNSPGEDVVPENLFTLKIAQSISDSENGLRIEKIVKLMSSLIDLIKTMQTSAEELKVIDLSLRLLFHITPFLNQYFQLVKVHLATSLGMHRTSCKLLSILLNIFHALATKGFCIPPELQEEADKSGATKFEDIEDGGLGEGEGTKDVSDKIETEDQLEDTLKEGQEKEKQENESDIKEEEKGIEMSDDFEGKSYDPEKQENDAERSDAEDEDEDLDKKMGEVEGDDSEKLDEKVWGSDSDDDDEELKSEDDTGGVSQNKQSELVAKDGKEKENEYKNEKETKSKEQLDDNQNDDEYQGEHPDPMIDVPDKEPEIVEIPDDIDIKDDDDGKNTGEDIDDIEMMDADEAEENQNDEDKAEDKMDINDEDDTAIENDGQKEEEIKDDVEGADSAEPYKGEDEGDNAEESKNDTNLPTHAPTSEAQALPSEDQGKNSSDPVEANEMDWETGSKQTDEQHKEGQAESKNALEQGSAHDGRKSSQAKQQNGENQYPKRKPTSSENRTVDESASEENLKHRPIEDKQSQQKASENNAEENDEADAYEHVTKKEDGVAQSVDLATKEQAAVKLVSSQYEEDSDSEQEVIDISSSDEEDSAPLKNQGNSYKQNQQQRSGERGDVEDGEEMDTMEGEIVQTQSVARGCESNLYTQHELWFSMSQKHLEEQRPRLENVDLFMSQTNEHNRDNKAITKEWEKYDRIVSNLAEELCEQLRLVLEPTKMSKLKGDYRTGKRLNIRKIIPYIASQFRKDKIWLRRTKPSKRQYQIMLAVDDSSSMSDNHSKQLTFETLSVLGKSLSLLEAGELGVVSFGEKVDLLLGFRDTYDPNECAKIFQKFSFSQQKTHIAQLLQYVTNTMLLARNSSAELAKETSQLLVILSDGRGIFSSGENEVRQAIRKARDNNVFMVFIIIDSPQNKDSILDLKCTEFTKEGVIFKPYIESFPFPFYIILREISALPVVLGEALRQWFELVTSVER